jgi:hypothetical protein
MSYSTGTAADRLTAVREAIGRCLEAQAYTVRGREKQSAKLESLMKMEAWLIQQVQDEANGGQMASVGRYTRPR